MTAFDKIADECSHRPEHRGTQRPFTELEIKLLASLREVRRLNNQGSVDVRDARAWHYGADDLLRLDPSNDDPTERYDAPQRVEHRRLVARLFR